MDIVVRVYISCNIVELRTFEPFMRAMDFSAFHADITVYCIDNGRSINIRCSPVMRNCYSWRTFKNQWERQHGPLHQ